MDVCCECCVLSGRGLCDEPTTRPEESCRLGCVQKPHEWEAMPNHVCDWASIEKCITGCISYIPFDVASPLAYSVLWLLMSIGRETEIEFFNLTAMVCCILRVTSFSSYPKVNYGRKQFRYPDRHERYCSRQTSKCLLGCPLQHALSALQHAVHPRC